MSKVPVGSSPEVQQSFREVWEALDPYLRTNIDLSGRRIINAGNARAGSDYVTQQQVAGSSEFEAFYKQLKERGLDGFPGRLSEPQEAVAVAYPDQEPTAHAIGQIYYDTATGELKVVTESGVITVTANSLMGLSDTNFSSPITGDSIYYDTTSAKWQNNPNIKLYSDGYISIHRATGAWFQATASVQNAGMVCNLPSQSWIAFGTTTHFNIKDETAGLYALTVAKATGATTIGTLTTGDPLKITSDAVLAHVLMHTTAVDGGCGFAFKNDAAEYRWSLLGSLNDRIVLRNVGTSANLVAFTSTGTFYPITANTSDLGGGGNRWKTLYLGTSLSITGSNTQPIQVVVTATSAFNLVQTSAINGQAGWRYRNDARTWLSYIDSTDRYQIRDETAGKERLLINASTGLFTFNNEVNGTVAQFNTTGLGGIVRTVTSAVNGYAGFRMANDAREWSVQIRTSDEFSIQDITAGLLRFSIDTAGAVKITPGPLTIEHTQPRLIFTDTTASAHDAYLQMDANIFQINVGGNSNFGCGQTYTSLYQEASIAGTGQKLGFFAATRVLKQTVTGSKGGNAALTSLLTALANYGFLTDSST